MSAKGNAVKNGTINFQGNDLSVWGVGQASAATPGAQAAAVTGMLTQSNGATKTAGTSASNINSYMSANKVSHIKGDGKNLIEESIAASVKASVDKSVQESVAASILGMVYLRRSLLWLRIGSGKWCCL